MAGAPGHVHLKDLGQLVAREIEKAVALQRSSTLSPWMMASPAPMPRHFRRRYALADVIARSGRN